MLHLLVNGLEILVIMFGLWLFSLKLKDVSIVDLFWGLGFVLITWNTYYFTSAEDTRSKVIVALVSLWGGRYSWFIARRNIGHQEDYRYQQIRDGRGENFGLGARFAHPKRQKLRDLRPCCVALFSRICGQQL